MNGPNETPAEKLSTMRRFHALALATEKELRELSAGG